MENVNDQDVVEFNEGVALMKANDFDGAVEKFRSAAAKGIDRPMEHYALAVGLYRKGDFQEALREAVRFLEMSPRDNRYVRQTKAILPAIQDRIAEAEARDAKPKRAISSDDDYNEGLSAYLSGDYEASVESFSKALNTFPNNKHAYNNLGLAHLATKNHKMALISFQKALDSDPKFHEARNNLGLAWLEYGETKAKEAFEEVVEGNPQFFDGLVNLASLCYRAGDMARARQLWQKAFALRPEDPQVRRNLGMSL